MIFVFKLEKKQLFTYMVKQKYTKDYYFFCVLFCCYKLLPYICGTKINVKSLQP